MKMQMRQKHASVGTNAKWKQTKEQATVDEIIDEIYESLTCLN